MENILIVIGVLQLIWMIWLIVVSFRLSDLENDSGKVWIGGSQYEARKVLIAIMRHLKVRVSNQTSKVALTKQTSN